MIRRGESLRSTLVAKTLSLRSCLALRRPTVFYDAAMAARRVLDDRMDLDTRAVVDQLFARATSFLGTTTQARMAECSRQTYRNLRLQAAAAAVAHERATWAIIEARMGSMASVSHVLGGSLHPFELQRGVQL